MRLMTQAQSHAYGVGSPSPLDLWIDAMLRVFAELVRHVARLFVPRAQTPAAGCDGSPQSPCAASDVLDFSSGASSRPSKAAAHGLRLAGAASREPLPDVTPSNVA